MKFSPNHHPFGIFHQKNSYTTIMVSPTIDSAGLVRTSRIPSWWRVIPIQIPEMVIVTGAKNQSLSGMILVETHSSTHDGSMVLLYMVLHGSHQCTPFMLAYIYQHHGSVMGYEALVSYTMVKIEKSMPESQWAPHMIWEGLVLCVLWNHRTLESSGGGLSVYGELNQNRGNLQVPKNRWRMDVYSPSHMVTMAFDTDPHFTKAAIPRCRQKTGLHFTCPLAI